MQYFEYNFKNNHDLGVKISPFETRHPYLSNDIWFVGNDERMKKLCPIEIGKFLV